jgi:hypothetical protein
MSRGVSATTHVMESDPRLIRFQRETLSSEATSPDSPTPRETHTRPPSTRPSQPRLWWNRWVCRCFSRRHPHPDPPPSRETRARRPGPSGGMVTPHGTGSRRCAQGWTWREGVLARCVWCRIVVLGNRVQFASSHSFTCWLVVLRTRRIWFGTLFQSCNVHAHAPIHASAHAMLLPVPSFHSLNHT